MAKEKSQQDLHASVHLLPPDEEAAFALDEQHQYNQSQQPAAEHILWEVHAQVEAGNTN